MTRREANVRQGTDWFRRRSPVNVSPGEPDDGMREVGDYLVLEGSPPKTYVSVGGGVDVRVVRISKGGRKGLTEILRSKDFLPNGLHYPNHHRGFCVGEGFGTLDTDSGVHRFLP